MRWGAQALDSWRNNKGAALSMPAERLSRERSPGAARKNCEERWAAAEVALVGRVALAAKADGELETASFQPALPVGRST